MVFCKFDQSFIIFRPKIEDIEYVAATTCLGQYKHVRSQELYLRHNRPVII